MMVLEVCLAFEFLEYCPEPFLFPSIINSAQGPNKTRDSITLQPSLSSEMHIMGKLIAVALALAELAAAQNLTAAELANLEHYWSYGRSEPSYPTPQSVGRLAWERAHARARLSLQ